jgi:hypothetical protein
MPRVPLAAAVLAVVALLPGLRAQTGHSCGCSGSGYFPPQWTQGLPPGFVPTAWGQGLPWGYTPTSWMPGHSAVPVCGVELAPPEMATPMVTEPSLPPQTAPAPLPAGEVVPPPRPLDAPKSK